MSKEQFWQACINQCGDSGDVDCTACWGLQFESGDVTSTDPGTWENVGPALTIEVPAVGNYVFFSSFEVETDTPDARVRGRATVSFNGSPPFPFTFDSKANAVKPERIVLSSFGPASAVGDVITIQPQFQTAVGGATALARNAQTTGRICCTPTPQCPALLAVRLVNEGTGDEFFAPPSATIPAGATVIAIVGFLTEIDPDDFVVTLSGATLVGPVIGVPVPPSAEIRGLQFSYVQPGPPTLVSVTVDKPSVEGCSLDVDLSAAPVV